MNPHHTLSLRSKLLLLGLLPALLVAFLVTTYSVQLRIGALQQEYETEGRILAESLASASVYGLFTGDSDNLSLVAHDLLDKHLRIIEIIITDDKGRVLVRHGRHAANNTSASGNSRRFRATVSSHAVSQPIDMLADDDTVPGTGQRNAIGQVEIILDDDTEMQRNAILLRATLITLLALGLATAIIVFFAARLLRPLRRLTDAVAQIRDGHYDTSVPVLSNDEFRQLELGFNRMAAQLVEDQEQQQRQIDQATAELTSTLEALEIQNAELDIARRQAIDANRVKSEFLANMSHEIRTPMNGIVGFAGLLQQTGLTATQAEFVSTINRSAGNLLQILNEILDFSKLEAGHLSLKEQPVDIREVLGNVISLQAPEAHRKGLELVSLIYNDVPARLIGDATRLGQIATNLLSNAIKFTSQGEVVMRVMLENEAEQRCELSLSVSDTGPGIKESEAELLFAPFKQGDSNKTRDHAGTGLGLSISRSLARAMGGDIRVRNNADGGATFTLSLTLPLADDNDAANEPLTDNFYERALIIDRHRLSLLATSNLFEQRGLEAHPLLSVDAIADAHPDEKTLIVMGLDHEDMQQGRYPQLLGKASQAAAGAPIIALAASSRLAEHQAILKAGARLCLPRPLTAAQLASAMNDLHGEPGGELARAAQPDDATAWLAGKTVLIADDNDINRQLMVAMLNGSGARVLTARDGEDAVAQAGTHRPDLIFMDIHMPRLDGIRATAAIHRLGEGYADIPVLALTADVSMRNRRKYDEVEFEQVLIKPIAPETLHDAVLSVLGLAPNLPENALDTEAHLAIQPRREPAGELPARDMAQALRITGGSREVADKLFEQMMERMPADLELIHAEFDKRNWRELWQLVHRLHGAASVCGTPALLRAVDDLQDSIRSEHDEATSLKLAALQHEADRLARVSFD